MGTITYHITTHVKNFGLILKETGRPFAQRKYIVGEGLGGGRLRERKESDIGDSKFGLCVFSFNLSIERWISRVTLYPSYVYQFMPVIQYTPSFTLKISSWDDKLYGFSMVTEREIQSGGQEG